MVYLDLVFNLALLIALSVVSGFIDAHVPRLSVFGKVLQGLLFGLAAVFGMFKPLDMGSGLIFDGRSVMISLASLYFGPITALVTVLLTGAARLYIGGSGIYMGLLVIVMSAGTGLFFRNRYNPLKIAPSGRSLYLFGLVVHVQMVILMVALPAPLILKMMKTMGPSILLLYPLATVLVGKILSDQVSSRLQMEALQERERQFRDAIDFLPAPVSIADETGKILFLNRLFIDTYGYTMEDLPTISVWFDRAFPEAEYRARALSVWNDSVRETASENGKARSRMYEVVCRDGTVRQVDIGMRLLGGRYLAVFQDLTERQNLESALKRKIIELDAVREATINSMAILSEFRDSDTGSHIMRTKLYVKCLLEKMGDSNPYSPEVCELVWHSAPLHDIGKIAIPDSILLKKDKLTFDEFELMKKHVLFGGEAIRRTREFLPGDSFLCIAGEIAEFHHERWDGTGYPSGLSGEAIPLSARIMAIADVYDACISERPYKPPMPHEEVVKIIASGAGTVFDPALVRVFLENSDSFQAIARLHSD